MSKNRYYLFIELLEILKDAQTGYEDNEGTDFDSRYNAFDDTTIERLVALIRKVAPNSIPGCWNKCKGCEHYNSKLPKIKCVMYDDHRGKTMTNPDECVRGDVKYDDI